MPWITYRAITLNGREARGKIEAESISAAIEVLRKTGLIAYETQLTAKENDKWWNKDILVRSTLKSTDLELFARELSTFINAQIPLDEALYAISSLMEKSPIQDKASLLRADIQQGEALSSALIKRSIFSESHQGLIQAGEASGKLGPALTQIANFLESENKILSDIRSALFYPALLMLMALGAMIFITTILLPSLAPIFEDSGSEMPALAGILLKLGETLKEYWFFISAGSMLLITIVIICWNNQNLQPHKDYFLLKLPLFGTLKQKMETTKFNRTLGMLLKNGVPLTQALSITRRSTVNTLFSDAAKNMNAAVKEGSSFNQCYLEEDVFSPIATRLIAVGERSGTLTEMILKSSDILDIQIKRNVDRLVALLTPVLTLGTGVLVGGIVLSVLSAILSVNDLAF